MTKSALEAVVAWCVQMKRTADRRDQSKYRHLQKSVEKVLELNPFEGEAVEDVPVRSRPPKA